MSCSDDQIADLRLERLPLMGGLSFTFPDPPKLTWEWTGVAGMGITGIAGALEEAPKLCRSAQMMSW